MKTNRFAATCLAAAFAFSGCAPVAKVAERKPRFLAKPPGTGTLVDAERKLTDAPRQRDPRVRLAACVSALEISAGQLARMPGDAAALRDYNFALSRIMTALHDASLDPWSQPLVLPGGATLSARLGSHRTQNPLLFDFMPADQYKLSGKYVSDRKRKEGLGAPLVVTAKTDDVAKGDPFMPGKRICYGMTAVAHFEGRRCVVSMEDPLATEQVTFAGRRFALAADFTAPLALALVSQPVWKLEILRLLNPQKYAATARLARMQPYDPAKIPVICVHGLASSPATWVPLINSLRDDPEIRRRYQFWFYSYPSGYPYPLSAAIFRSQLDAIATAYPGHRRAVLIGHSMGGMISRLMITDSGERLWRSTFGKTPEQTQLSPKTRALLEDTLIFKHRPDVARVVFVCAPHRGAEMASNWLGRLGSKLVRAPAMLRAVSEEARMLLTADPATLKVSGAPNSVDMLAPNNRFVKAVNAIPIAPGIPYHTICGDRGKGNTPESSDGLVPYWSSHLDGAQSELIVPSDHSGHQDPAAIREVGRILKLHAKR